MNTITTDTNLHHRSLKALGWKQNTCMMTGDGYCFEDPSGLLHTIAEVRRHFPLDHDLVAQLREMLTEEEGELFADKLYFQVNPDVNPECDITYIPFVDMYKCLIASPSTQATILVDIIEGRNEK